MLKSKDFEIVTLSENTALGRGLLGEWGLSILVKTEELDLLMDTGAGISAAHNATALSVDLSRIETIVLSHGHYDHTGGIPYLLTKIHKKEVRILAHPAVHQRKYGKNKKKETYHYGGIPYTLEELERLGARFSLSREPTRLSESIIASGEEPMTTDFETVADTLYIKENGGFTPDPMADDQSLYIETELGLVIILGCAHRGVINIIRHAQKLTGMDSVYMVLGGTHMVSASKERLENTIAALKEIGVEWIGVSHCTGLKPAARLDQVFGKRFFYNNAGTIIRFPYKCEKL